MAGTKKKKKVKIFLKKEKKITLHILFCLVKMKDFFEVLLELFLIMHNFF